MYKMKLYFIRIHNGYTGCLLILASFRYSWEVLHSKCFPYRRIDSFNIPRSSHGVFRGTYVTSKFVGETAQLP